MSCDFSISFHVRDADVYSLVKLSLSLMMRFLIINMGNSRRLGCDTWLPLLTSSEIKFVGEKLESDPNFP